MKAVILAGGLGTRLRPLTNKKPKPMLPLGNKPLLEHLIKWIRKNGVKDIVLCVSYLHETIEKHFGDGSKFGMNIEYAVSKKPLATAGQLKTAQKFIDDTFVCVYGDSLFDFSLRNMISDHKKKKSFITMSLYEHKTSIQYGVIDTKNNGKVLSWNEKPEIKSKINIEPENFDYILPKLNALFTHSRIDGFFGKVGYKNGLPIEHDVKSAASRMVLIELDFAES